VQVEELRIVPLWLTSFLGQDWNHEWQSCAGIVTIRVLPMGSGNGGSSLADVSTRWHNFDLDVVPKAVKALHAFGLGEIRKIAARESGDLGLRNAHAVCGFLRRQLQATDCQGYLDHQAGLDLQFLGFGEPKIVEDVPGADFELEDFSCAPGHFASPLRSIRLPYVEGELFPCPFWRADPALALLLKTELEKKCL
jgi:hypothetical protein